MPKRKKKEEAEVKADETVADATSDTQEVPTLAASVDEVIEQATERAEQPPAETSEQPTSHAERLQKKQAPIPDPFDQWGITLGDSNDSPKMRLYRSSKYQQVAIQFDEKPDEKYLDQLREAGYRWRGGEDKVWTKQFMTKEERAEMDSQEIAARKVRVMLEAEKLFEDIGNSIRADLGLPPDSQRVGM